MGRVEREEARLERGQLVARLRADALGRPRARCPVRGDRDHLAIAEFEGLIDGIPQPRGLARVRLEAVHDHLDRVSLVPLQLRRLLEPYDLAVDPRADEAASSQVLEQRTEAALAVLHQRRCEDEALPVVGGEELLDHRLGGSGLHGQVAPRAVGDSRSCVEHPEVIDDLRERSDRRAVAPCDALLVDGDRWREPVDRVHVGLLEPAQELASVGGERLQEPSLPFAEERVEGQRGLPGAGDPGDRDQRPAGKAHIHGAQVVLARSPDGDRPVTLGDSARAFGAGRRALRALLQGLGSRGRGHRQRQRDRAEKRLGRLHPAWRQPTKIPARRAGWEAPGSRVLAASARPRATVSGSTPSRR